MHSFCTLTLFLLSCAQVWKDNLLVKVPVTYDSIKIIELEGINFEEMNAMLYVLHLLLHSPNLQELRISVSHMSCYFV